MSRCQHCGARIGWVQGPGGKWVAVECRSVVVRPDRGTEGFITPDGKWIKGERTIAGPTGGNLAAYIPHRRYCPGQYAGGGRQS